MITDDNGLILCMTHAHFFKPGITRQAASTLLFLRLHPWSWTAKITIEPATFLLGQSKATTDASQFRLSSSRADRRPSVYEKGRISKKSVT
jgi:hypothetical protein